MLEEVDYYSQRVKAYWNAEWNAPPPQVWRHEPFLVLNLLKMDTDCLEYEEQASFIDL